MHCRQEDTVRGISAVCKPKWKYGLHWSAGNRTITRRNSPVAAAQLLNASKDLFFFNFILPFKNTTCIISLYVRKHSSPIWQITWRRSCSSKTSLLSSTSPMVLYPGSGGGHWAEYPCHCKRVIYREKLLQALVDKVWGKTMHGFLRKQGEEETCRGSQAGQWWKLSKKPRALHCQGTTHTLHP